MSFDEPVLGGGTARVGLIGALSLECESLRRLQRGGESWCVLQSGPGALRAAAAAERALECGARALVSWGLAGALDPALAPGTVLIPRRILGEGSAPVPTDAAWHARFASLANEFDVHYGDLFTAPAALESPQAKRAAALATHAVAVDMESLAIAAVAARSAAPFVALRVVVDGAEDALPRGAERWIDERGNRRFAAALHAAATPSQWPALLTLARRYRIASRVLERLACAVARTRVLAFDDAATERAGG